MTDSIAILMVLFAMIAKGITTPTARFTKLIATTTTATLSIQYY